jgi:hypothetical protein
MRDRLYIWAFIELGRTLFGYYDDVVFSKCE